MMKKWNEMETDMPVVDSKTLRQYKKKFNFFETPDKVADQMADLINDIGYGARILEPSAGLGALIRATQKSIKYDVSIDFCEIQEEFIGELLGYGANRVGGDFMKLPPTPVYNAIIMNPPFSNKGAELHIEHAWMCLKPGGRIVALVGSGSEKWVDEEFMGHVFVKDEMKKAFKETPVTTFLYLIHKPMEG